MKKIEYIIKAEAGKTVTYTVIMDEKTGTRIHEKQPEKPAWTELSFHQCPNCPLTPGDRDTCPVALEISDLLANFDEWTSYQNVDLTVITETRTIKAHTSAQKAISALLGLVIALSDCPVTSFFKPMAAFHLPIASLEDTIYRAAGAYLLAQYYLNKRGQPSDLELDGLRKIYKDIHLLNNSIADRIRAASQSDSTLNALIILDLFSSPDICSIKLSCLLWSQLFIRNGSTVGYCFSAFRA